MSVLRLAAEDRNGLQKCATLIGKVNASNPTSRVLPLNFICYIKCKDLLSRTLLANTTNTTFLIAVSEK